MNSAAFGPTVFLGGWVNIRCCGCCGWRFRPYGDSLFLQTPKKSKQKNACSYVRPSQARVPSLRDRSGRSGYGLLRCTTFRCVWLRQTVAALPRPDQSLHSAFRRRRWIKIKSFTRANAHRVGAAEGCDLLILLLVFCGSEPAREGGLKADLILEVVLDPIVGVSLLAKAPCQPTNFFLMYINPVGAGLPAKAA